MTGRRGKPRDHTSRKEINRKEGVLANGDHEHRDSNSRRANPKEPLQTVQFGTCIVVY
jgi:hypothetical protein